jgi:hypothetical protein
LYRNVFGLRISVRNRNWNVRSSTASPVLSIRISYRTLSSNFQKFGPELGDCSGTKFEMSTTRSGRSGLTKAYTSVLSARGS